MHRTMHQQYYQTQIAPTHHPYGPNSMNESPSMMAPNQTTHNQMAYFNANMLANQTAVTRYEASSSASQIGEQQLSIFDQYPMPRQKGTLLNGTMPFSGEAYAEESINIYTEPTLIDHNDGLAGRSSGKTSNLIPPMVPPPPPPIFTASVIEATTTTSSTCNDLSYPGAISAVNSGALRNSSKTFVGKDGELSYADNATSYSCDSVLQQASHSQLTITGQDLEITLSNGEMRQTVLSSPKESMSAAGVGSVGPCAPQLLYYYSNQRIEFLPLCDLLFNIISLAAYFCDVVFDSVTAYTLYLNDQMLWLLVALFLILTSTTLSQLLSYKWYLRERRFREQLQRLQGNPSMRQRETVNSPYELRSPVALTMTHILFGGVLLRYFKLFVPVNLSTVKREVRDLCVLRMVHGFCQAGPMMLLQVYLVWLKPVDSITDLNIISIFLSLFSLCWALSSFSKNIRQCQIHKLVLTWLGVIFQFLWRLGTVTSRIVALTIYATVYHQWIFVVLFLHWFSMLLWLSTPDISAPSITEENATNQKKPNIRKERIRQNALIAWVYIFCFINMENSNPRHKMAIFYLIMFLENGLLLSICLFFDNEPVSQWYRRLALYLVFGGFFFGMLFMWLYYRFFHIRHLKHTLDGADMEANFKSNIRVVNGHGPKELPPNVHFDGELPTYEHKRGNHQLEGRPFVSAKASPMSRLVNALSNQIFPSCTQTPAELLAETAGSRYRHHFNNDSIPGVFNCRLNPALKRKKKKPSTIPPPPHSAMVQGNGIAGEVHGSMTGQQRVPLETIDELVATMPNVGPSKHIVGAMVHIPESVTVGPNSQQYSRRNVLHQAIARPSTNTSILTRQMRQPSADTFWRKSALSARSFSISPSTMLKSDTSFRLPPKHPFSSSITTPTSPVNFLPNFQNFTDKLEVCTEPNESNSNAAVGKSGPILRPKPILQSNIDLDNDLIEGANYGNDPSEQQFSENQGNGTLLHYYYNPQSGKLKLRSQTPEVLLYPHADSGRIFYDYPSSVVEMQPDNGNNWNGIVDKKDENELIFTRQCQRPPVPGREGDDKSEENGGNEKDNCSYVEGKRSLLGYGLSRARLEKLLEKKQEERYEVDSHKSQFSHTLPNEVKGTGKGKHLRYATGLKKKKPYGAKSKKSKRTSLLTISQHTLHSSESGSSSSNISSSMSSSGEDGDIESDINLHERLPRPQMRPMPRGENQALSKPQNVYDHVHREHQYEREELPSSHTIERPLQGLVEKLPLPVSMGPIEQQQLECPPLARIIRGPAQQYAASQEGATLGGQKIANYHLSSSREPSALRSKRPNSGAPLARPKPLYHSAKYKRHHTPL